MLTRSPFGGRRTREVTCFCACSSAAAVVALSACICARSASSSARSAWSAASSAATSGDIAGAWSCGLPGPGGGDGTGAGVVGSDMTSPYLFAYSLEPMYRLRLYSSTWIEAPYVSPLVPPTMTTYTFSPWLTGTPPLAKIVGGVGDQVVLTKNSPSSERSSGGPGATNPYAVPVSPAALAFAPPRAIRRMLQTLPCCGPSHERIRLTPVA